MNKVFETVTDSVKENAEEMSEAVKETIMEPKRKREGINKTISKIEDIIKYAINFELRLLELLGENTNFKKNVNFECEQSFCQEGF